jgi:hypothetical protein
MQLDGHYAAAQLEKLDTYKGRIIPLYAALTEYLMLPQFPSARFRAWVEQYDRLPEAWCVVVFSLLPHEDFPQHLSEHATVRCQCLKFIDGVQTLITYNGSLAQYMAQRYEIFGDTVPTSFKIIDHLTDEEQAYFDAWYKRYECYWPQVGAWERLNIFERMNDVGSHPHPQLLALSTRSRTHLNDWYAASAHEPINDFYVVVEYSNGELHSRRTVFRD